MGPMIGRASALLALLAALCGPPAASAQQPSGNSPPPTRPRSAAAIRAEAATAFAPGPNLKPPAYRTSTTSVEIPVLVSSPNGRIVGRLNRADFTVSDNGARQHVQLEARPSARPVSLLVCVERSRQIAGEFSKIAALGPLLKPFLSQSPGPDPSSETGQAALVVFDSKPTWVEPFSANTAAIAQDLQSMPQGDGGAAILDAVGYSINLLEKQPANRRRILLLIAGPQDRGSRNFDIPDLVERLGTSNVLVVSLILSPSKTAVREWATGHVDFGPRPNVLAPLLTTVEAMRQNIPGTLASLSGGESVPLTREKSFGKILAEAAIDARARYILSFRPLNPAPGMHLIRVSVTEHPSAQVTASNSYWAIEREHQLGTN